MTAVNGSLRKAPVVGAGTKEKENPMTHLNYSRTATDNRNALSFDRGCDGYLIDEEFDDFLDRELFAQRETLSSSRHF
jgi:hypothetical protein